MTVGCTDQHPAVNCVVIGVLRWPLVPSGSQFKGRSAVRSVFSIAILFSLLVFSGCGRSNKITMAPEGSDAMQDAKYGTSLGGPNPAASFGNFLESCSPAD